MFILCSIIILGYIGYKRRSWVTFASFGGIGGLMIYYNHEILKVVSIIEELSYIQFIGGLFIIICFIGGIALVIARRRKYYGLKEKFINRELLPKRKRDLQDIKRRLYSFPVLGINAEWGMGKSILVEKLLVEFQSQGWEIIQIDALRFSTERLVSVVLGELQEILWHNRMIGNNVYGVIGESKLPWYLDGIASYIGWTPSPSACLDNFAEKLNTVDKMILISYEDIDRITDVNAIKHLLALNEVLSKRVINLKVIYQYSEVRLKNLGIEQEYIEKYIPQTVNLSKLGFVEVLEQVLSDRPRVAEACNGVVETLRNLHVLMSSLEMKLYEYKIRIPKITPSLYTYRLVEEFLQEAYVIIRENTDYDVTKKAIVFKVLYIKYFLPELFDLFGKLSPGFNRCQEVFKYNVDGNKVGCLEDLMDIKSSIWNKQDDKEDKGEFYAKINEIMNREYNKKVFNLLNLLGYSQMGRRATKIQQFQDEEIDRVVCHIIAPAVSPLTNVEYLFKRLKEIFEEYDDVALRCEVIQTKLFRECYWGDEELGNNTNVQKMGEDFYAVLMREISELVNRNKVSASALFKNSFLDCFRYYLEHRDNKEKNSQIVLVGLSNYMAKNDYELKTIYYLQEKFILNSYIDVRIYLLFISSVIKSLMNLGYLHEHIGELWRESEQETREYFQKNQKINKDSKDLLQKCISSINKKKRAILDKYPERSKIIEEKFMIAEAIAKDCLNILNKEQFINIKHNLGDIRINARTNYGEKIEKIVEYSKDKSWDIVKKNIYEQFDKEKLTIRNLEELYNLLQRKDVT